MSTSLLATLPQDPAWEWLYHPALDTYTDRDERSRRRCSQIDDLSRAVVESLRWNKS